MELAFLRHRKLVEGLGAGDTVRLSILELELDDRATVLAVEAAPAIEAGEGRLVTGTIRSRHMDLRLLKLQGLERPIGVTGGHPLFSEDRGEFVPVSEIRTGERLRTRVRAPRPSSQSGGSTANMPCSTWRSGMSTGTTCPMRKCSSITSVPAVYRMFPMTASNRIPVSRHHTCGLPAQVQRLHNVRRFRVSPAWNAVGSHRIRLLIISIRWWCSIIEKEP